MLSFLYVYSDHSILECYNLFSGVELSMRSFFVIIAKSYLVRLSLENTNTGSLCYHFMQALFISTQEVSSRCLTVQNNEIKLTYGFSIDSGTSRFCRHN